MLRARSVIAFLFVLSLFLSAPVYSDSVEAGFAAFKQGDKELAYKNWLPLAIQGDARAQFFLSVLYEQWKGGAEDRNNSKRWLTAAANNGFIPAQFNMGNNYHQGKYGRSNNKMAAYWWEQAAIQGLVEAQYQLASIYYWGEGIERDLKESFYWYEKASKNGSQEARAAMLQARAGTLVRGQNQPVDIAYDDPRIVSQLSVINLGDVKLSAPDNPVPQKPAIAVAALSESPAQDSLPGGEKTVPVVVQKDVADPNEREGMKAVTDAKPEKQQEPDLNWVLQQPAENRTIQLFASGYMHHCEDHVKQILERYKLETHAYAFAMKGRKLCAVVHGSYTRSSDAKAGLRQLPREIRRGKPWIRKLGRLQQLAR